MLILKRKKHLAITCKTQHFRIRMAKLNYDQEPSRKVDTSFLRERNLLNDYCTKPNGGLTWEEYLLKMNEFNEKLSKEHPNDDLYINNQDTPSFQVKPNSFLFPESDNVEFTVSTKTKGYFYNNESADLSNLTYLEICSIAAYILRNENIESLKNEQFFRPCACNIQDPDATVFHNKPITLVDPFDFFTIEGFKVLISVAKIIKQDFIDELNKL